jgi:YgiT-type zinc finger domain-containing protein
MLKITKCPTCGSRRLKAVKRNWTDEFEGQRYTVPNLEFHECPACGERLFDRDAMRKIEAHSPAYAKTHATR